MTQDKVFEELEAQGLLKTDLQLGVVTSVSAHSVRANLGCAGNPSGAYFSGGRYGKGEVGEFVLIEGQQALLFGRIVEVRLPEGSRQELSQSYVGLNSLDAIAVIDLLGSIALDRISITAGVANYPRLGDRVYAAPHQFLALIPRLMDSKEDNKIYLSIGNIDGAGESLVSITPERLFGRHCAILGATGGGKSYTTARIIEECIKHNAKIILLDATGEYRNFEGEHVVHCHLGNPVDMASNSKSCSLPPTSFPESDFIALFDPAGKVQGPKLRAAIRSLKLAAIDKTLAQDGTIIKIGRQEDLVLQKESLDPNLTDQLDDPITGFNPLYLPKQIFQECYSMPNGREDGFSYGQCLPLITRINGVMSSKAFECVFKSKENPISTEIVDFLSKGEKRLLRICLSGIQYEFGAREIISNALGRILLSKARGNSFKKCPIVVILDEAHNFIGKNIGSEDAIAKLDAFELIAKEGRKYGLNICLATQRPRDITEGVLSQMGTLIVHRLTNDKDREVVERACGAIDRSASAFLPNLKPGEAAIIGVDFPIPLTVQMKKPTVKPASEGPNYQKSWNSGSLKTQEKA